MDVDLACQGDFQKNFFAKFSGIFLTGFCQGKS